MRTIPNYVLSKNSRPSASSESESSWKKMSKWKKSRNVAKFLKCGNNLRRDVLLGRLLTVHNLFRKSLIHPVNHHTQSTHDFVHFSLDFLSPAKSGSFIYFRADSFSNCREARMSSRERAIVCLIFRQPEKRKSTEEGEISGIVRKKYW